MEYLFLRKGIGADKYTVPIYKVLFDFILHLLRFGRAMNFDINEIL